jgi:hypothetical protein
MLISMALVVLSLVAGMIAMLKGGEFNKKYGNKLMRARVTMQGIALAMFVLAVWSQNSE